MLNLVRVALVPALGHLVVQSGYRVGLVRLQMLAFVKLVVVVGGAEQRFLTEHFLAVQVLV